MTKTLTGVIIRLNDSKDADKVVTILTKFGEKRSLLAKGVKKAQSRKAHSIDLGNFIQVSVNEKYAAPIITDIKLLHEAKAWKHSYNSMLLLQMSCEILDAFATENQEEPRLFLYTKQLLQDTTDKLTLSYALWTLYILQLSGNLGDIKTSVLTEAIIEPDQIAYLNGYIGYCNKQESTAATLINTQVAKTQLFALKSNFFAAQSVLLSDLQISTMLNLHLDWLEIAMDKQLKVRKLLQSA